MAVNSNDIASLCQQYLAILYSQSHLDCSPALALTETQGEILSTSVSKLLKQMHLTDTDVFADLGSGTGKIVAQVFLQSAVKAALGIEIVADLHQRALSVGNRIQQELPDFFSGGRTLNFFQGSFLTLPLSDVTVALVNGVCFSHALVSAVGEVIEKTTSIHTVLSLRPIGTLHRLKFRHTVRLECSWDTALCYVYR